MGSEKHSQPVFTHNETFITPITAPLKPKIYD